MDYIKEIKEGRLCLKNDLLPYSEELKQVLLLIDSSISQSFAIHEFYWVDFHDGLLGHIENNSMMTSVKLTEVLNQLMKEETKKKKWVPSFGENVLAWDDGESTPQKMVYLGTDDEHFMCCFTKSFRDIRPVCEWFDTIERLPQKTVVTLKEIAEWKGVEVDQIEIED